MVHESGRAIYLYLVLVAVEILLLLQWLYRENHLWQEQCSMLFCILLSCNHGCLSKNNKAFKNEDKQGLLLYSRTKVAAFPVTWVQDNA